jgi:quercetin dioxygenase-like cupin family protein
MVSSILRSSEMAIPSATAGESEDSMSAKAVIRMPGQGKKVMLAGQPIVFLVTGEDSKNNCMFEFTMPPGFSTGLHVHRVQEETFYVLDGECEWRVGDQLTLAKPGSFLFIPPGVPHSIDNASDRPMRMFLTVSPSGHEHYFEQLAQLVSRGEPPDVKAIGELRSHYDTEQLSALKSS